MFRKMTVCLLISAILCVFVIGKAKANSMPVYMMISSQEFSSEEMKNLTDLLLLEGFNLRVVTVDPHASPEEIREIVRKNTSIVEYFDIYEGLPTGEIFGIESDYFFNEFREDVSILRNSKEFLMQALRKPPNVDEKVLVATPIFSFFRWIYGCCWYMNLVDPSLMVADITKNVNNSSRLFEQEGVLKSIKKPTMPLNRENFESSFLASSIIFALTTYEPIGNMLEDAGEYPVTARKTLDRAIWLEDKNKDRFITDDELEIKNYFDFKVPSSGKRKVGIFPQLTEGDINLSLFSTAICVSQEFSGFVHIGDSNGTERGIMFVWRSLFEQILNGKTIGQAWAKIPGLIDGRFPLEGKFMPETKDFLRLRIKGLPFVRTQNQPLKVGLDEEVQPNERLRLENLETVPISYRFEPNALLSFEPGSGLLFPNEEVIITFSKKQELFKFLSTEPSRKKFVFLRLWFNNTMTKTVKIWYYW